MDWLMLAVYGAAFVCGAAVFLPAGIYGLQKQPSAQAKQRLRLPQLLVSAAGGGSALLCLLRFGAGAQAALCLAFLALLTAVALKDALTLEISDLLCGLVAALAVISFLLTDAPSLLSRVIGLFCVSVPLLLLTLLVPDAFGGGDIKLMAACGLFLGWRGCLLAGFIAIVTGGLWGAGLLLLKRKSGREHFAFGPFLCAGAAVCALYEETIVSIFLKVFDLSAYM